MPAWVPPAGLLAAAVGTLAAAPLELAGDAGASTACAPAIDGALAAGTEELVLDGEALDGELVDWVSLDPAALSPVEPVGEELELSPELLASVPSLVWAVASPPAPPVDDSPPGVLAADAALADVWAAAERAAAAREMSAMLAVTKWTVPAGASVMPAAVAKGATRFSDEYIESSMFS